MIQAGKYKMPWDMTTPNRQFNPFEVARQSARFLQEAAVSLARRNRASCYTLRACRVTNLYKSWYRVSHQSSGLMLAQG